MIDRLREPGNDIERPQEPKFESDSFTDLIYDEKGKGHQATISYSGYYYDYALRICKLTVSTGLRHVEMEDVLNLLQFRENKRVEIECNLELV
ncbi:MAG TPA: hypothetical protein VFU05_02425 [Cyclobacteriaceae bacterium]|nr:hypothetical protein [Cyclobacteriaceae bacterium]